MPRPASKHPTELELEILKILWAGGSQTVRQVRQALAPRRKLAHTSVMTIMGIMTEKGYLRRKDSTGGYVYTAQITQRKTVRQMLGDIVERAFDGSAFDAMLHLLQASDLDDEELRRLRQVISDKSRRNTP